jgi:hypothetical protein
MDTLNATGCSTYVSRRDHLLEKKIEIRSTLLILLGRLTIILLSPFPKMTDSTIDTVSKTVSKTRNSFLDFKTKIASWGDYTDSDSDDEPVTPIRTVRTVRTPVRTPATPAPTTPVATAAPKQCPWAPIKTPVVSFKDIEPIRIGFKDVEPAEPIRIGFKDVEPVQPVRIGFNATQQSAKPEGPRPQDAKPQSAKQQSATGICTLMVKNLPRDTTPQLLTDQVRAIFASFGPLKDVYIPTNPSGPYAGTIKGFAKVQFLSSQHALSASLSKHFLRRNLFVEFANQDR